MTAGMNSVCRDVRTPQNRIEEFRFDLHGWGILEADDGGAVISFKEGTYEEVVGGGFDALFDGEEATDGLWNAGERPLDGFRRADVDSTNIRFGVPGVVFPRHGINFSQDNIRRKSHCIEGVFVCCSPVIGEEALCMRRDMFAESFIAWSLK